MVLTQNCLLFCMLMPLQVSALQIFGSMIYLDQMIGSISMVIIVSAVLAVEKSFHLLHHMTHDTPFEDMVNAIEKELMVVGFMAFIFKIILQTAKDMDPEWVLALEFADLVVPVTTFVSCFIGIMLIVMSLKVVRIWTKAYHLHLYELLDSYYIRADHWWHNGKMSFLPFSLVNSEMEFRIFHSIFCEQYNIQRKAFAFDEYVYRKFEKFLLVVLHIEERNWLLIIVFVMCNWLRLSQNWDTFYQTSEYCRYPKYDKEKYGRRRLAASEGGTPAYFDDCEGGAAINSFIYSGVAMLIFTIIVAIFSRLYELRLMRTRGIINSNDYALYLQTFEDAHRDEATIEKSKLNELDLKNAVEEAKVSKEDHEDSSYWELQDLYSNSIDNFAGFYNKLSDMICCGDVKVVPDKHFKEYEAEHKKAHELVRNRVTINAAREAEITKVYDKKTGDLRGNEDFTPLFLFNSPGFYFKTVEVLIMPISFYVALWICNFATLSMTLSHGDDNQKIIYQFETILPGIACVIVYMYCVKVAALLKSIVKLDNDSMLEVIEQTESTRFLGQMMRTRMLERLRQMGDPEKEIKSLFEEIDDNNSNLLSRQEFQIFLEALGITFSRKKWSQIFVEIDLNNDDEISFKELFLFLFPDNDAAKAAEIKRLHQVGLRACETAARLVGNAKVDGSDVKRLMDANKNGVIREHGGTATADKFIHQTLDAKLKHYESFLGDNFEDV